MILRHLRLPGIVPYPHASKIQDLLVSRFLAHKASPSSGPPPSPVIITAQFHPVYTCGRREIGSVFPSQQEYLRADGQAEFYEALRGGQTTFHGPGQLIAYPIIDLKRHGLTPRSYVCLLEKSLMGTCQRFGVETRTTEHPGVWVSEESKIAALGIHLRRNVSSHGIGLNVNTDLKWFGRIVACGLEGKRTTSLEAEGVEGVSVDEVGEVFVREFADRLEGVDDVQRMAEGDVD
ncbi:octanoyltransferase-like protein [Elsinoe australis]|uniref:Octanoyltransferase n=1 Tax=Elsinoe australis TaxID=40998 RepID=A0A4U7AXP8_9PEZI|nr:octanoyltransferase-like protein [Elsinoe australis]